MNRILFDRRRLFQLLEQLTVEGCTRELGELHSLCDVRLTGAAHGNMPQWMAAWEQLPPAEGTAWDASGAAIVVTGRETVDQVELKKLLMQFHPWRKGPFELFGVAIDTEWRSDWKWERVAGAVDFRDCRVLDVGCGNGYYGWKMQAAGAELVVGCDPFPLYCCDAMLPPMLEVRRATSYYLWVTIIYHWKALGLGGCLISRCRWECCTIVLIRWSTCNACDTR